jgi:hypothetical protein
MWGAALAVSAGEAVADCWGSEPPIRAPNPVLLAAPSRSRFALRSRPDSPSYPLPIMPPIRGLIAVRLAVPVINRRGVKRRIAGGGNASKHAHGSKGSGDEAERPRNLAETR